MRAPHVPSWAGLAGVLAVIATAVGCGGGGSSVAPRSPSASSSPPATEPAVSGPLSVAATVIAAFPHDPDAFTEGLLATNGQIFESSGLLGVSDLRRVEIETGAILQRTLLPADEFGEGISLVDGRIAQLTWKSGIGHVYDAASMLPVDSFSYAGEGWGLAAGPSTVFMSDGTSRLRLLDPQTLAEFGHLDVTSPDGPVDMLNELELVDGELWANVWKTDRIARIDPSSGVVLGWIDVSALRPPDSLGDREAVANGIAFDSASRRLFVTGKRWDTLYEIALPPKPSAG